MFDNELKPAMYANLTIPPVKAAVYQDIEGQDCRRSFEIPMEQAHAMEREGFEVHWISAKPAD